MPIIGYNYNVFKVVILYICTCAQDVRENQSVSYAPSFPHCLKNGNKVARGVSKRVGGLGLFTLASLQRSVESLAATQFSHHVRTPQGRVCVINGDSPITKTST